MTALSASGNFDVLNPLELFRRQRRVVANVATYYKGGSIALDSTGKAVKVTATAGLKIVGWYSGEEFTAVAGNEIEVLSGIIARKNSGTDPVTIADLENEVYAEDDQTIARTSNGGTLSPCGRLVLYASSVPYVMMGAGTGNVGSGGAASSLYYKDAAANVAAIRAIPAAARVDGGVITDAATGYKWTFEATSAVGADDWHLVPDAGTGEWVRRDVSLADLAAVTAAHGAHLVGSQDLGNFTAQTTTEGQVQELYQHLFSAVGGYIPIPLSAWREVSATGDVGDIAAIGGVLASDSTPVYSAVATSNEGQILWATTEVGPIGCTIALPRDFDDTADATLDLEISSGATNAATMGCASAWSAGAAGTEVADSTVDVASATPHRLSITIAAADIPVGARRATFRLTPPAHAADPISIWATGLAYKRKLLTA